MTSPFQNAINAAFRDINAFAGESVTYRRGSASAVVTAVVAPKDYEAVAGYDAVETIHCHDWLIVAADLELIDLTDPDNPVTTLVLPAIGDTLTDGSGTVYQVLMVPGRNVYDETRGRLTIHTKVIA